MQRCELAVECCVCDVALCPWDEIEEAYLSGKVDEYGTDDT
jgi:hypothetical protein